MIKLNNFLTYLSNLDLISNLDCVVHFTENGLIAVTTHSDLSTIVYRYRYTINIKKPIKISFLKLLKYIRIGNEREKASILLSVKNKNIQIIEDNVLINTESIEIENSTAKFNNLIIGDDFKKMDYTPKYKVLLTIFDLIINKKELSQIYNSNYAFLNNEKGACKIVFNDIQIVYNSLHKEYFYGNWMTLMFAKMLKSGVFFYKDNVIYAKNENYEIYYNCKYDFKGKLSQNLPNYGEFEISNTIIKEDYVTEVDKTVLEEKLMDALSKLKKVDIRLNDSFTFKLTKKDNRTPYFFPVSYENIHILLAFIQNNILKKENIIVYPNNLIKITLFKKEHTLKLNGIYITNI